MATLITALPKIAFPHELDVIQFETNEPVRFRIEHLGKPFQTTLTPTNGKLVVLQLAPFLRELLEEPGSINICADDEVVHNPFIIPLRNGGTITAFEFCKNNFLSSAPRIKTTFLQAKELLAWPRWEADEPCINASWLTTEGVQKTEQVLQSEGAAIAVVDCSPARIIAPTTNAQLIEYRVTVGKRVCKFRLLPKSYTHKAPFSVEFRNAFGVLETYHFFGTITRKSDNEYTQAKIRGKIRSLRVKENDTFTLNTGVISSHEAERLRDLAASKWIVRMDNGHELVVEDLQLEEELSPLQPQSGKITFRSAAVTQAFEFLKTQEFDNANSRIFDPTFDTTFE